LRRVSEGILPFLLPSGTYNWRSDLVPLLLWLATAAALGLLAYAGIAALLRVEELRIAWARARSLAARLRGKHTWG
jgi:hypothetical protein